MFFLSPVVSAPNRQAARKAFSQAQQSLQHLEGKRSEQVTAREIERVISRFEVVVASDPSYSGVDDALLAQARLYRRLGTLTESTPHFRRALDRARFLVREYPSSPLQDQALLEIGILYQDHLMDGDSALHVFNQIQQKFPRRPAAQEAATRAGRLTTAIKSAGAQRPAPVAPTVSAGGLSTLREIRYWSNQDTTRVVLQLDRETEFTKELLSDPPRIYFDFKATQVAPELNGKSYVINDLLIKQVRVAQNQSDRVRVVLDFEKIQAPSIFELYNPFRLVIDTHAVVTRAATPEAPGTPAQRAVSKTTDSSTDKAGRPVSKTASGGSAAPRAPVVTRSGQGLSGTTPAGPVQSAVLPTASDRKQDAAESPVVVMPKPAAPTRQGNRTLTRTLGLKVDRIVLDPGHGGHDTGTIGPQGLREKELVLDVALKLKDLLESRLGAQVVLTRKRDDFVPLEERTAIANQHSADLFVSVHANSSPNPDVSGVETYFLSFAKTASEREVASRENAVAQKNIRDLEKLVKKIALRDFVDESSELAAVIQENLFRQVSLHRPPTRNRGVKQAPFIVLIGARMPSILAEISFISNPEDEAFVSTGPGQSVLAEALYNGIEEYFKALGAIPAYAKTQSAPR
ncbi:MAG: N-acetylmuramoyl-L-alanine amidase [Acidobacteriota bacterium]